MEGIVIFSQEENSIRIVNFRMGSRVVQMSSSMRTVLLVKRLKMNYYLANILSLLLKHSP